MIFRSRRRRPALSRGAQVQISQPYEILWMQKLENAFAAGLDMALAISNDMDSFQHGIVPTLTVGNVFTLSRRRIVEQTDDW